MMFTMLILRDSFLTFQCHKHFFPLIVTFKKKKLIHYFDTFLVLVFKTIKFCYVPFVLHHSAGNSIKFFY